MLNREQIQKGLLPATLAALAVSIMVVVASLTHAVATMASYA